MDELKINKEKQHVTLEEAILQGGNALIPYDFDYPNTDFVVEVKLKPITSGELSDAGQRAKLNPESTVDLEVLKIAMFNVDETSFSDDIIMGLPAGLVLDLVWKIFDISGFDQDTLKEKVPQASVNQLPGF